MFTSTARTPKRAYTLYSRTSSGQHQQLDKQPHSFTNPRSQQTADQLIIMQLARLIINSCFRLVSVCRSADPRSATQGQGGPASRHPQETGLQIQDRWHMAGHHYTIRHVAIVSESLISTITDLNVGRKYQILLEILLIV